MKINYLAAFFGSLIILFAACTKITSTDIGTGLIPGVDSVNTRETTINVYAKNAGLDSISPTLSQIHVVGNIDDPLFGKTDARINFQLSLPNSNFSFEVKKDSLYFDSVVLVLSYNGIWGDTNKVVPLHVNEIDNNQTFLPDTSRDQFDSYIVGYTGTYDNTVEFSATNRLTDAPAVINPKTLDDSIKVFRDSGINMIRIKLNESFGKRLLLEYDTLDVYKSDSSFRNRVKGLQVYADPTASASNSLLRIGLLDANTKLALYYHYQSRDSAAGKFTYNVRYFTVNATSAHSNFIKRDRSLAEINAYLPPNNDPTTKNDNRIYLQGGPGTYATITIDSSALDSLPNYIIHRAELLMEQDKNEASDMFLTPPYLFLLAKNDTSRYLIPGFDTLNLSTADAIVSSGYLANYTDFGGVPRLNNSNNSLYSFNITRYIQGIVTKNNRQRQFVLYAPYNEPFQLLQSLPLTSSRGYVTNSPTNTPGSGRVRLYGGGDDITNTHRMRLHIVYSIPH